MQNLSYVSSLPNRDRCHVFVKCQSPNLQKMEYCGANVVIKINEVLWVWEGFELESNWILFFIFFSTVIIVPIGLSNVAWPTIGNYNIFFLLTTIIIFTCLFLTLIIFTLMVPVLIYNYIKSILNSP